jgi:hypothetical protein
MTSGRQQHGHVAAHAVALQGDRLELVQHARAPGAMSVVHLRGVLPGREERIAPVGDDEAAARPEEGLGMARDVVLGAADVRMRALREQRMVGRGVVGDEVEHEPHAVRGEARAE